MLFKIFLLIVGVAVASATKNPVAHPKGPSTYGAAKKLDASAIKHLKELATKIQLARAEKHPEEKIPIVCQICEGFMSLFFSMEGISLEELEVILEASCAEYGIFAVVCIPLVTTVIVAINTLIAEGNTVTTQAVCNDMTNLC